MKSVPSEISDVFASAPAHARERLLQMRNILFEAAEATGATPLTETLKWGQPAYLPPKRIGTTLRLGWSEKQPEFCAAFVHCQTNLVSQFEILFPSEFTFQGTRAILTPLSKPLNELAFFKLASMVFTYHRNKG